MNRSIRLDAVLVQAVIAGALSFAHLHDLALAAGQGGWKAWAYPVSVDLLLVASWRRLRSAAPSRLAWSWFLIALSASLGANVATAGLLDLQHPPVWLRFGIAGWPALAFLGGTLLAHTASEAMPEAPLSNPSADSVAEPHAPEPAPDPQPVDQPVRTDPPDLPITPPVPAALVDHARKLANDHRARTGSALDADTLRARLGVPAQLAEAIAAQLA
ncbi:SpdA2 protein [Streptomyces xanthochromogenes]